MAYQDFTTFIEVDPNNYWSQTSVRNTGTNLPYTDSSYVYKDLGVDYFEDFEHYFDFNTTDGGFPLIGYWALCNTPGTWYDMTVAGDGMYFLAYGGGFTFGIFTAPSTSKGAMEMSGLSQDTTYYVKVGRSGTDIYYGIYPTANDRENDTNAIFSNTYNSCPTTKYKYLQCGYPYGVGGATTQSGYVENMDLTPGAPGEETFEGADTVILSDEILVSPTKEILRVDDTISLDDRIIFFRTYHEGTIYSNETWKAEDNPHGIIGNVSIANGATLTIEAGCEIYFEAGTRITIMSNGTAIKVDGTEENPILFTSANKLPLYGGNPAKGDWEYINDGNVTTPKTSYVHYAIVEYAGQGSVTAIRHIPEVKNCIIRHCNGAGIEPYNNTDIYIENNIIYDVNLGIYCGWGLNSTIDIQYNLIYDTVTEAIEIGGSQDYNGNINIINNTLVGSGSDEGIFFNDADGIGTAYVHNNIIYDWDTGIKETDSNISFDVDYNDYYSCNTNVDGVSAGTNSITSDPEFINISEDNYLIRTSSPCAFSGNETYDHYIGYDINFVPVFLDDQITLLRDDSVTSQEEDEATITIGDEFEFLATVRKDISQKIRTVKEEEIDIDQKFNTAVRSTSYFVNLMSAVNGDISDFDNDIRTLAESTNNVDNDVRVLADYQVPGDTGFQSLGKEYVKVYIGGSEQTDLNVDSISITKIVNGAHTATFELGRAYDSTKPSVESVVTIYYHNWLLYKGYITSITPASTPEAIRINCNNLYWKENREKLYFFVGHEPVDNKEKYYYNISTALTNELGWSPGIGNFIPQTMNLFGIGKSEVTTDLITNCGNYGWYYDKDENKKLWTAGRGSIIDLERQEIGKNLGLYQVLRHQFTEDISTIVNKLRVQMGDKVIRNFNDTGETKEYPSFMYENINTAVNPDWDEDYEVLSKNSDNGYGWDWHKTEDNEKYKTVFTKYELPFLNPESESWTDRYPPQVEVILPYSLWWECSLNEGVLTEGFTIDYDNQKLIFNEPIYLFIKNDYGEIEEIRAPMIRLKLWKKKYYSNTDDESEDPEIDISNPLLFITDKVGTYSETIIDLLQLTNLSIQIGGSYLDADGNRIIVPSWDDTDFAEDLAYWQLSNSAYKSIRGSIDVTLDSAVTYGIELSNRIQIDGVTENPLNIISMTYNMSNFQVTIQLQNGQYYRRKMSIPNHFVPDNRARFRFTT